LNSDEEHHYISTMFKIIEVRYFEKVNFIGETCSLCAENVFVTHFIFKLNDFADSRNNFTLELGFYLERLVQILIRLMSQYHKIDNGDICLRL
jgi:hypothetical protein